MFILSATVVAASPGDDLDVVGDQGQATGMPTHVDGAGRPARLTLIISCASREAGLLRPIGCDVGQSRHIVAHAAHMLSGLVVVLALLGIVMVTGMIVVGLR